FGVPSVSFHSALDTVEPSMITANARRRMDPISPRGVARGRTGQSIAWPDDSAIDRELRANPLVIVSSWIGRVSAHGTIVRRTVRRCAIVLSQPVRRSRARCEELARREVA
ncbi:MAG: hypothetical protein ABI678_19320, partial [Kofleriaceae bacterium]